LPESGTIKNLVKTAAEQPACCGFEVWKKLIVQTSSSEPKNAKSTVATLLLLELVVGEKTDLQPHK